MKIKKVAKINGIEFVYDGSVQYEKNGHIYCLKCNERIDGKAIESEFFNIISRSPCKCMREKEKEEEELKLMLHKDMLRRDCFRTVPKLISVRFNDKDPVTKEYSVAHRYVQKFKLMKEENIGLLLYGNIGSGKTHLAAAIANEIIETYNVSVKFRNIPQIINDIESYGFNIDKNDYINSFCKTPLLILDDFGIERKTEYSMELLYQIINARYEMKLPTIISTNISVEDISDPVVPIEQKRIYSRILEMCTPIGVTGKDRRIETNKRKTEIATRELLG